VAVLSRGAGALVLNPRYLDFANHHGFQIRACGVADMEKSIAANARMLALAGHLNRKDLPGIRHGKTLMMRPKPEAVRQQTDDDKVGLGSFGMKAPVLEHFRRIAEPDVQYRLALQRQQLMREQDAEAKKKE
jgi:hypothetical protein